MVWAALLELTFLIAVLVAKNRADATRSFLDVIKPQLIMLYFSAAFWKLTTSWYDTDTSCAPVLLSELLSLFPMLPVGPASNFLLSISPVFVASIEFAVPAAMLIDPRAGVLLALVFHQTINLMPMTYAGGFSIAMCVRMCVIAPGSLTMATRDLSKGAWMTPTSVAAGLMAAMYAIHSGVDTACVAYLVLTLMYLRSMMSGWIPAPSTKKATSTTKFLAFIILPLTFTYSFLTPMLGLQAMASSTMYGNLKQFGGTNHMLVSTGMLQGYFSKSTSGDWASDAFGGGMLRVDYTNSTLLKELTPAESTGSMPGHAIDLLKGIGAGARYFEMYAARNYYGRRNDLGNSALHNRGRKDGEEPPPYAEPAYELRRVLKLARTRGEPFTLKYTRLPYYGTPAGYRDFVGPQVSYTENPVTGYNTCEVTEGVVTKKCAHDEIALLPAPPSWLMWLLHPYPMPLLPQDTTEVHCST
jgi:hypothetical protein